MVELSAEIAQETIALRKELRFGAVTLVNVVGHAAGAIAAVALTWRLRSGTGVVLGEVCGAAVMCVMSYRVYHFRPVWNWDWAAVRSYRWWSSR